MTQDSTNQTFHRQTTQVEKGRPVEANSVEFLSGSPPDLMTNAKRVWVDLLSETFNYTIDGVNFHSLAQQFVNVKSPPFNAKGNGITDDKPSIQAAINSLPNGGTVFFPVGDYLVQSVISVPSNIRLLGDGYNSRIFGNLLSVATIAGNNAEISRMAIENNRLTGCIGINLSANVSNINVNNCRISGANSQGVNANAAGIKHVVVENNLFTDIAYGVLIDVNANDFFDVRITNNTFTNIYGDGIEINNPGALYASGRNFIISENYITVPDGFGTGSTGGFGIGIAGATRGTISTNLISNCRYQGIHLEDECRHITISNNIIEGNQEDPVVAQNSGIYVQDGDYISIIGNECYNLNDSGIHLDFSVGNQATNFVVTGNTVFNCLQSGILIAGDSTQFSDSIVSDNISTGNGLHGIMISGQPLNFNLSDNKCRGNSGYGLFLNRSGMLYTMRDNTVWGNTLGDIGFGSGFGQPLPQQSANIYTTQIITSNQTPLFSAFTLGTGAKGIIYATAKNGVSTVTRMFDVSWNGTTLTSTQIAVQFLGAIDITQPAMSGNFVQFRGSQTVADGTVLEFDIQFKGLIMLK